MEPGSGGQDGGTRGGRLFGGKSHDDTNAVVLKELIGRLQDHSDLLRREIRRLQRALAEINGAIALSLERVERLRSNMERLQAIFGGGQNEKPREDQRSGFERRAGAERRRARSNVTGLLRWIEGTSLDRRKVPDRRNVGDRRKTVQGSVQSEPIVVPRAPRRRLGEVISLADYRRSRTAVSRPQL